MRKRFEAVGKKERYDGKGEANGKVNGGPQV